MPWQAVIGLEVHVQLNTRAKIFSSASSQVGQKPNSNACIIDLALPGTLPVLNQQAVFKAITFGHAVGARINQKCFFSRKNYFYPDLPKSYQISQDRYPILTGGGIYIDADDGGTKFISLTRAHLEEDAGKSIHRKSETSIDLNRAGIPLLEVVSEPVLHSSSEAISYLKHLHTLVQYLDICTGNMQEGAFRCDANVSVRMSPSHPFGTRVEIKNLNSFKFIEKAINYEINRQIDCIQHKEKVMQESRLFDESQQVTKPMRTKENANDYRYFPDPDIPPLHLSEEIIEKVKASMPELPAQKKQRFIKNYALSQYDAKILTSNKALAEYFEQSALLDKDKVCTKIIANLIIGDMLAAMKKHHIIIHELPISPKDIFDIAQRIHKNTLSSTMAKKLFESLWKNEGTIEEIIKTRGLVLINDDASINQLVDQVIDENPRQLHDYLAGKSKLFGYFVGQAMKRTQGKANPKVLNDIFASRLEQMKKSTTTDD